jgi:CDP-diacylglycerol---glycerol-3-phosphate 3-phosphatidyltransferase
MNLPNSITALRIALIPFFILVLSLKIPYKEIVVTVVFVGLALSDSLDGYIARRTGQVTDLGKFMDPLADKLLITAALVFLIGQGVEAWMAFVIIAREFLVTGLRIMAIKNKVVIKASSFGKLKTISQIVGVVAVIMNLYFAWWFMLIAVLFTIVSGLDYFLESRKLLRE